MSTNPGTSATPPARPPAPAHSGLLGVIRRHPLGAFFTWFFTVGQLLAFTPLLVDTGLPAQVFIVGSTLIGLLLPTLVITRIGLGPAGLRALWRRAVDVRVSLAWYALAVLALPLLALAIAVALLGLPAGLSASVLGSALAANLLLPLLFTFLPNNWWEEVAWQGFVQDRLQSRWGPARAALLTAPLFALQHVALVVGNTLVAGVAVLVLLTVLAIPFRFLTGWVYNRSGSLFLVGLIHGVGNALASGSGFQEGFLRRLYPGEQVPGMVHLLALAALGLIVVVATRGRLGVARRATPAAADPVTTGAR